MGRLTLERQACRVLLMTSPTTTTTAFGQKEASMATILNSTLFVATVSAANAEDAHARVEKRLPEGFLTTGNVQVRSERHLLWDVQVCNISGDVNDAWVVLTSYGISPSEALGSVWEEVLG